MIAIPNMEKPEYCRVCHERLKCKQYDGEILHTPDDCPLIEIDDEAIDIAQDIIDGCKELKERVDKGIVRCEECVGRKKNGFCLEHNRYERNDDGFCNYGERRADDRGRTD